jgi:AraC family transcriptional regulator
MPYLRQPIFRSSFLDWQQIQLSTQEIAWSDEYRVEAPRLVVPLAGSVECRLSGPAFTCDPLHGLWLTPEQGYRLKQPSRGQRSWVLSFEAEPISSCAIPIGLAGQAALRRMRAAWSARRMDALALEENLIALWQQTAAPLRDRALRPHRAVERAKDYLASAPGRRESVADIARAAGSSPFHLARLFSTHTGIGLHGYRNRLRMASALDRMSRGEDDLSRLALDLGFSSHSHFSQAFHRAFGATPRQMRRNLIAQDEPA